MAKKSAEFKAFLDKSKMRRLMKRGSAASLSQAGRWIRADAAQSIRRGRILKKPKEVLTSSGRKILTRRPPSRKGTPPKTWGPGYLLKKSIWYEVDKRRLDVLIGPRKSFVGNVGKAHEFGVKRKKNSYSKRSFMGPALEKNLPRIPKAWRNKFGVTGGV